MGKTLSGVLAAAALIALFISGCVGASSPQNPPGNRSWNGTARSGWNGTMTGYPDQALLGKMAAACDGKAAGDACEFIGQNGTTINRTCRDMRGNLTCAPQRSGRPPGGYPQGQPPENQS